MELTLLGEGQVSGPRRQKSRRTDPILPNLPCGGMGEEENVLRPLTPYQLRKVKESAPGTQERES